MRVEVTKDTLRRVFREMGQHAQMQRNSPTFCPIATAIRVQGGEAPLVDGTGISYTIDGRWQILHTEDWMREYMRIIDGQFDGPRRRSWFVSPAQALRALDEVS